MVKCPNCKTDMGKPEKSWSYGQFNVQAYSCNCGIKFREYAKAGKHSFTLQLKNGRWAKA